LLPPKRYEHRLKIGDFAPTGSVCNADTIKELRSITQSASASASAADLKGHTHHHIRSNDTTTAYVHYTKYHQRNNSYFRFTTPSVSNPNASQVNVRLQVIQHRLLRHTDPERTMS